MNDTEAPATRASGTRDYRGTVFLPQTAFPMKGDLPKREPDWLQRWEGLGLWTRLREQSKGRPAGVRFTDAARFELAFWEMCWSGQAWPA